MDSDSKAGTKVRRDDVVELSIESLAFGGEGVARLPSTNDKKPLVVFVEDVVPGDVVEVKISRSKHNFARGFVQKTVQSSKDRIVPRCKHFGSAFVEKENGVNHFNTSKGCGGCVWQFLDVNKQREYKEQQVRDALTRIGGFQPEIVLPILGGDPWYYRNKMEYSFSRDAGGKLSLGLHLKRRHHDVIELTECFLLEPFAGALVTFVREFFQKFEEQKGFDPELALKSFTVRVGKNTGQIMMIVSAENGKENFMEDFKNALLTFCAAEKIALNSLYFLHVSNHKGQRNRTEERLIHGVSTIQEQLLLNDGQVLKFEISPQAFFQPNTKMAELIYAKTLEAAQLTGKETVFDLYCGTGTIGLFCASKAAKVYGIELNKSAVENAKANASMNGIANAEFLAGDVQEILSTFQGDSPEPGRRAIFKRKGPDVVLVDPPRNGLAPKVVDSVAEFGPRRVVYVSCNPTSLARDAALFAKKGYMLVNVQPVDQFPQTYHIENVALFKKTAN